MANKDARMRFNRACRLVMEEGTRSVRDFVLANLNPWRRDGLPGTLRPLRQLIEKLRDKSTITADQFDVLYPPTGDPINVDDIDLTLWVILLRNATCVSDKAINKKDSKVTDLERICRADVMCIKETRNALFHKAQTELDDEEFYKLWREVSQATLRLCSAVSGNSQEKERQLKETLNKLKTGDPYSAEISVFQIKTLGEMREILFRIKKAIIERWSYGVLVAPIFITVAIMPLLPIMTWNYFNARRKRVKCIKYIAPNGGVINYVPRSGWGARTPKEELTPLETPVKYVILSHSAALARCTTTEACCKEVNRTQEFNMEVSCWSDVAYNFMVGEHGVILEGRGPDVMSACAYGWNGKSLSFGFLGVYECILPSDKALEMLQDFLSYLVAQNKLQADYIIYCLRQVRPKFPVSPGALLYREIQTWPHWRDYSGDATN